MVAAMARCAASSESRSTSRSSGDFIRRINFNVITILGFDLLGCRRRIVTLADVTPRLGKSEKRGGGATDVADGARRGVEAVKPKLQVARRHRVHVFGKLFAQLVQLVAQILQISFGRLALRFYFNQFVGNRSEEHT